MKTKQNKLAHSFLCHRYQVTGIMTLRAAGCRFFCTNAPRVHPWWSYMRPPSETHAWKCQMTAHGWTSSCRHSQATTAE